MEINILFSDQFDQEVFKTLSVSKGDSEDKEDIDKLMDNNSTEICVELSSKSVETLLKLLETDWFFKTAFLNHNQDYSSLKIVITEPLQQHIDYKS